MNRIMYHYGTYIEHTFQVLRQEMRPLDYLLTEGQVILMTPDPAPSSGRTFRSYDFRTYSQRRTKGELRPSPWDRWRSHHLWRVHGIEFDPNFGIVRVEIMPFSIGPWFRDDGPSTRVEAWRFWWAGKRKK